jgi:hypothetical protein
MILSHKYKFIFLKTAKTAGTSIEIALSKFLGDDDIITPISPVDELLRKDLGHRGPQNYLIPLRQLRFPELAGSMLTLKRKRYFNHMTSEEVRQLIGEDIWNGYYKFCFERNPFDRAVSLYYWCHKVEPRPSLKEFLNSGELELLSRRGIAIYTDKSGRMAVDRVCLYEKMTEELEDIRKHLRLPEPLVLPNAKGGHRVDRRHYSEMLDDECRETIMSQFAREIQLFDYRYETTAS